MGYWTTRLSTVFKGTTALGFKQRWNARKIIKKLRKGDHILFQEIPEQEKEHKVTKELRSILSVLKNEELGIIAFGHFMEASLFQESNFFRAVKIFLKKLDSVELSKSQKNIAIDILVHILNILKVEDGTGRKEYKDVESLMAAAEKGHLTLREAIRDRFKSVNHQSFLEKIAVRFETKEITSCIDKLDALSVKMATLSKKDNDKDLTKILSEASRKIEIASKELNDVKKRAFLWLSKILYDLFFLEDLMSDETKHHLLPVKPVEEDIRKIQKMTEHLSSKMRTIAQGYRVQIAALEDNIQDLQKEIGKKSA